MTISGMIRQYRYYLIKGYPHKDFTQKGFASYIGVSLSTVKFWETGRCRPSYVCMMDLLNHISSDKRVISVTFLARVSRLVMIEYGIIFTYDSSQEIKD